MKRFLLASSHLYCKKNQVVPVSAYPAIYQPTGSFNRSGFLFFTSLLFLIASLLLTQITIAQTTGEQSDAEYRKVIKERSAKIVNTLAITDSVKYNNILNIISNQYFQLNTIHEATKAAVSAVKKQSLSKEEMDSAVISAEEKKSAQLTQLHDQFISHLKANLSAGQVDQVKDQMTYRVMPITWAAYQDMLPGLTLEQKDQIYAWLKEARELAMDAESSEKKHQVFGKFKGKINNYLSAAGYDMKKEGEAWQKRIKEREAAKTKNE